MDDLSLHILDIAENSITAGATTVEITVRVETGRDLLTVEIIDDGEGMTPDKVDRVMDPFYTTRTTRRVGLGLPLFAEAARATGGSLDIRSSPSVGTTITASFCLSHIDRKPLGDMPATIVMLVAGNPGVTIRYRQECDGQSFTFDTQDFRERFPGIDLSTPRGLTFIRDYLTIHSQSYS